MKKSGGGYSRERLPPASAFITHAFAYTVYAMPLPSFAVRAGCSATGRWAVQYPSFAAGFGAPDAVYRFGYAFCLADIPCHHRTPFSCACVGCLHRGV
jgi:hypothetical protein